MIILLDKRRRIQVKTSGATIPSFAKFLEVGFNFLKYYIYFVYSPFKILKYSFNFSNLSACFYLSILKKKKKKFVVRHSGQYL